MIKELLLILGITYLGNYLSQFSPIPFPGPVIGLILLFFLLSKKIIKVNEIENTTNILLNNLSFLFLPPGVALINSFDKLSDSWLKLIFLILITTTLTLATTGLTVQYFIRRQIKKEVL